MLAQFTYEMCTTAENCKKTLKSPNLGVQYHSRSSMLTPFKSSSPVLVTILQYVCVYLQGARNFFHKKTRFLGAAHNEDFVILGVAVLIQCQGVTDGLTDGRTDGQTSRRWLKRAKHYMVSRVKTMSSQMWNMTVSPKLLQYHSQCGSTVGEDAHLCRITNRPIRQCRSYFA